MAKDYVAHSADEEFHQAPSTQIFFLSKLCVSKRVVSSQDEFADFNVFLTVVSYSSLKFSFLSMLMISLSY